MRVPPRRVFIVASLDDDYIRKAIAEFRARWAVF
jgi:hypothetical protein